MRFVPHYTPNESPYDLDQEINGYVEKAGQDIDEMIDEHGAENFVAIAEAIVETFKNEIELKKQHHENSKPKV